MAITRKHLALIHRLTGRHEPQLRRVILKAIGRLGRKMLRRDEAKIARMLRRNDIDGVLDLIDERGFAAALRGNNTGINAAHVAGAKAALEELPPPVRFEISFDRAHPRSLKYLKTARMELIREVTDDTRQAVRAIIETGFTDRRPPIRMARDIREIVGLTEKQGRAVYNFRQQLEVRADIWEGAHPRVTPAAQRRLSAVEQSQVRKHMKEGHLGADDIDRLVTRYRDSLTNLRAQGIARTEALKASNAGQQALWEQAAVDGLIDPERTKRQWVATMDNRVSPGHAAANGQQVGLDEPFIIEGEEIMHPPARPNCRCTTVLVFT